MFGASELRRARTDTYIHTHTHAYISTCVHTCIHSKPTHNFTGIKVTDPETVLCSNLGEDVGFRDIIFFSVIFSDTCIGRNVTATSLKEGRENGEGNVAFLIP